MEIKKRKLTPIEIENMGIESWPIWEKEKSVFDWYYDTAEQCYIIQGKVIVHYGDGESIEIEKGDFVEFPAGLKCRWEIVEGLKKHYNFP